LNNALGDFDPSGPIGKINEVIESLTPGNYRSQSIALTGHINDLHECISRTHNQCGSPPPPHPSGQPGGGSCPTVPGLCNQAKSCTKDVWTCLQSINHSCAKYPPLKGLLGSCLDDLDSSIHSILGDFSAVSTDITSSVVQDNEPALDSCTSLGLPQTAGLFRDYLI